MNAAGLFNIRATVEKPLQLQWLHVSVLFCLCIKWWAAQLLNILIHDAGNNQQTKGQRGYTCKISQDFHRTTRLENWFQEALLSGCSTSFFKYLCRHCHLPKPPEKPQWFTSQTASGFNWALPDSWHPGLCCSRKQALLRARKHSCRQLNVCICSCVCVCVLKGESVQWAV